jgi:hypothetical protein
LEGGFNRKWPRVPEKSKPYDKKHKIAKIFEKPMVREVGLTFDVFRFHGCSSLETPSDAGRLPVRLPRRHGQGSGRFRGGSFLVARSIATRPIAGRHALSAQDIIQEFL